MAQGLLTLDLDATRERDCAFMPTLVTGDRLVEAVRNATFIERGDLTAVEGVKYDFHMGARILKASFTQAINIENLSETERSQISVDPGEVVFVMTRERLRLPSNMIATLSPKRTLAHSGIIVLGGFAMDPNYSGVLWMGLYNFSSTKFPLRPGKKLIAAMFYELTSDEKQDFPRFPVIAQDDEFPEELVNLIKNYKPIELKGILDEVQDTKRQIEVLRADFTTDKSWKEDFRKGLESHNNQIDKLLEGLREEKAARERDDDRINTKLDSMSGFFTIARVAWIIAALVFGAGLEWLVPKLLDASNRPQPAGLPTATQSAPAPPLPPAKK